MDMTAVVEALAPDHDAFISNITLEHDISEQRDGTGQVCARVFTDHRIVVTIDLLARTPDAE